METMLVIGAVFVAAMVVLDLLAHVAFRHMNSVTTRPHPWWCLCDRCDDGYLDDLM